MFICILAETGEYWRLLNDGRYVVFAEANGGLRSEPVAIDVKTVAFSEAHIVNLELMELEDKPEQEESAEPLDGYDLFNGSELLEGGSEEDEYMAVII